MISIESLRFAYPRDGFKLQIPSFSVPAGQTLAVIGPSGSGKTTLLNLIAGIVPPDSGHIRVADTPVHALADAARRDFRITHIGFVFQDSELLDYLGVLDNILHPYRITRVLKLTPEVRLRQRGIETIFNLGCSRLTTIQLVGAEIGIIALFSALLCLRILAGVAHYDQQLVRALFV
jgi:putative ABC transport system ATP-binding protein